MVSILLIAGITLKFSGTAPDPAQIISFNPSYRWNYSEISINGSVRRLRIRFQSFLSLELL